MLTPRSGRISIGFAKYLCEAFRRNVEVFCTFISSTSNPALLHVIPLDLGDRSVLECLNKFMKVPVNSCNNAPVKLNYSYNQSADPGEPIMIMAECDVLVSDTLEAGTPERRQSKRFPICLELSYKTLNQRSDIRTGKGNTIDISSSGMLITSDHEFPVDERLEVTIYWPVQLDNRCSLSLVARCRVKRCEKGQLALAIEHHEFRIRPKAPRSAYQVGVTGTGQLHGSGNQTTSGARPVAGRPSRQDGRKKRKEAAKGV